MKKIFPCILIVCFLLNGCASTLRKSPSFEQSIKRVKTIVVIPSDVKVYQLTAGGVPELIDEWSDIAKKNIRKSLEQSLGERYGFKIQFVEEDWLKAKHKKIWDRNRALYNAVVLSAVIHSLSGPNVFSTKVKNFDYTLGTGINPLATAANADALLFVYGYDYDETLGRSLLWWWNLSISLFVGVDLLPRNPSLLIVGLVDGRTGDLLWFKAKESEMGVSFRNEKNVSDIIKWLTQDFVPAK